MPNWCECDLYLEGTKEDLAQLLDEVKSETSCFDFNKIIPYPQKYRKADDEYEAWAKTLGQVHADKAPLAPKDGFNNGGYDWCNNNWGTKWNASMVECSADPDLEEGEGFIIKFNTAWQPPIPIIRALSAKFPDIQMRLDYFERGMEFNGRYKSHGNAVKHKKGPYFGNRGG